MRSARLKPRQNRDRHQKTAYFRPQQYTARYSKRNPQAIDIQRLTPIRYDKLQQQKLNKKELVRMRSAVRIRPAAPETPYPAGMRIFCFLRYFR